MERSLEHVDIVRDWSAVIFEESGQTLGLEDGRTLGYAEWGDPSGVPLVHFHGSSSSRLERPLRAGSDGSAWEARLLTLPWGFDLQDIAVPVALWHGDADINSPLATAIYLSRTIPDASLTVFPNEGHFLILKRWGEIIRHLTDTAFR